MKNIRHDVIKTVIFCLAFVAPHVAFAQSDAITLRTDRILDGRGGILSASNIVVRDGAIVEIGSKTAGTVYDLRGLTAMPGGIDTHNHFAWHFDPDGKLHDASPEEESPVQQTLYAAENAYLTLLAGITTLQSLGSSVDGDVRDAFARGTLPGPRVLTSLGAVTSRTGGPDSIKAAVKRFSERGANVIKIFGSASIRVGGTPTLSQEQMNAACDEAKRQGLRTAVHAHGPESARRAVLAGCTVIEHGALLDDETLQLMAEKGTYYDPHIGLIFNNYFENKQKYLGIGNYSEEGFAQMESAVPKALAVFKRALSTEGLKIVFGTDAVAGAHGHNFEELIYRVEQGGQDPMDAIISATSRAAGSLNLADQIGAITAGMRADLIASDGNPLEDITSLRRIVFVMKDGVVYKAPQR
jgi:imidazolonepropionase-like amidohydrolase